MTEETTTDLIEQAQEVLSAYRGIEELLVQATKPAGKHDFLEMVSSATLCNLIRVLNERMDALLESACDKASSLDSRNRISAV